MPCVILLFPTDADSYNCGHDIMQSFPIPWVTFQHQGQCTPEQMSHQVPQGVVVRVRQVHQEVLQQADNLRAGAGGPGVVPGVCMQGLSQRDEAVVEVERDHGVSELGVER